MDLRYGLQLTHGSRTSDPFSTKTTPLLGLTKNYKLCGLKFGMWVMEIRRKNIGGVK